MPNTPLPNPDAPSGAPCEHPTFTGRMVALAGGGETVTATMRLRFKRKDGRIMLQQLFRYFTAIGERYEWQDVPCVEEDAPDKY